MRWLPVFLYDVFRAGPGGGNTAGVVLHDGALGPDRMQRLAADLSATTTAFVVASAGGAFEARLFTPLRPVAMCGHAAMAAAACLADEGRVAAREKAPGEIRLRTEAGELGLQFQGPPGARHVSLFLPPVELREAEVPPGELARRLGTPEDALDPSLPPQIAEGALRHLLVGLRGIVELRALRPGFEALAAMCVAQGVETVGVFCLPTQDSGGRVRLRDLCPAIGNPEEAASGTTSAALAGYLHRRGLPGDPDAPGWEVSVEQGFEMGRPSRIRTRLHGTGGRIERVEVSGGAVCRLRGEISPE